MNLSELVIKYRKQFGEFPPVPPTYSMALIQDMIEDSFISGKPITQEEIFQRIKDDGEPVDIAGN